VLRSTFVRYGLRASFVVLACCLSHAQTPTISSISPNPVGIGQSVTISGTNFGTSGSVTFSGVAASTSSWASTAIIATVPVGTTTGNIVVTAGGHSSSPYSFTLNNGPVSYVYDDLGRLIAVIDVNGNAAEYAYDSVGNIQSISHFTSAQVSIIDFGPESGTTGALVTINGTGFSATPSQDTVKFNSVTATVSSATNTQLQVSVPSSATTGPISLTSPNGSATSTQNFTVTSSNGLPTITSFSPSSGIAGTAVNIVGTSFNSTPANDELSLNVSQAVVSAATSTTLATTVASGTASGHFTLLTPAGDAVSSQDFYVPFGSHVATDIGFTARIASGGSQAVTLASSKIGLVLFDGMAGQRVSVGMSGSTFSSCNIYLVGPNNSTVATTSCTAGNTDLPSTYLPTSGTYSIGIDPGSSSGGLTVTLVGDFLGTIAINGPPVTVTTAADGQDARLNFTAMPGQRIVVYATNVTNPDASLNLVAPTGGIQGTVTISNIPGYTFFIDAQTLGAGTNQLWIQHYLANVGSETLQIFSVPADFTATLTVPAAGATGAAVRVPSTGNLAVGQNASLTFTGTTGQKLSFNVINSTIGTNQSSCGFTLYDPNQNAIVVNYCGTTWTYVDTVTLALTGTYTVYLNPAQTATGSVSISINNDKDVTTPTISPGTADTVTSTVAGQDVRLSFTATAGQRIAISATSVTNPYASLNLVNPSGVTWASTSISNAPWYTFFIDTQTLSAGTNQLWVQHSGTGIGGETLLLSNVPADLSKTATIGGAAVVFTTVLGQNANISFSNPTSQSVTMHWSSGTYPATPSCGITVTGPSPSTTQVGAGYCTAATGTVSLGTLSSGTYNIFVNPNQQSIGGMSLTVTTP
jgi:YD repeat-containing protein